MKQPVPNKIQKLFPVKKKRLSKKKEYGTSKLEDKFAKEFLDKLGVKYIYQFKAESIGRFYDFYLPDLNLIIEIDGVYWHSKGIEYKDMNPTQKRNHRVDEAKNKWALFHCIPILRIWEDDINNNASEVMKILKEKFGECSKKMMIQEEKKKRH